MFSSSTVIPRSTRRALRRQSPPRVAPLAAALALFITGGCASFHAESHHTTITWEAFGKLPEGGEANLYTLKNSHGMTAKVTSLGAALTELDVPDRNGAITNVVVGFDTLDQYLSNNGVGATTGRVANRIGQARFVLDGKEIHVTANSGRHQIHGGRIGFSRVLWEGSVGTDNDRSSVTFTYHSRDGEEGFPGNLLVTVKYSLTDANELILEYTATTDKPTVVNLTNHSYFNLGGSGDVLGEQLQIFADQYTIADRDLIPTGEIAPVKGTGLDFTKPVKVGAHIGEYVNGTGGYDHNFIVRGEAGKLRPAARVFDPKSGRVMECLTTEPAVQLYTANHFNGSLKGIGGVHYPPHGALCLETQHYPDSINHPNFPSTVLRPGETFHSVTEYKFSTANQ